MGRVGMPKESTEASFCGRFERGEASGLPPELAGLVIIDSATVLMKSTVPEVEIPGLKLRTEDVEVDDGVSPGTMA